ncbi:MAG: formate dehydrogenase accessory sulfurtransferase FdhD, partial [Firmicutes bacterium]|nr:formate dehydrogenase accessory sulfurtransferase FdhD [Bacillota bacterium]
MSGSSATGAAGAGATARRIWRYRVPSPRAAETDASAASVQGQAVSEAAGGAAASPPGPAAGAALDPDTDWLAEEFPLTLFVNGQEMLTTLCSPSLLEELVLGLLFDEGLISSLAEVHSLRVDRRKGAAYAQIAEPAAQLATRLAGRRLLTSGCGQRSPFYAVGDASLPVLQWQGTVLAEPLLAVLHSW